ncbi:MAG TPA: mannosyltransferase family protein [Candidatus Limnocylindria bacterium]|nr:mannosyltransferase family protein [Candidatus Limnocylindria bacterium]
MFGPSTRRTDLMLVAATLAVKLAVFVIGFVGLWLVSGHVPNLTEPWDRWDAPHYTDIAVFGYMAHDPGTLHEPGYQQVYPGDVDLYIVFFPLFPWLVGAVNVVVGAPAVSALIVSTIASLFVAPVLYRLVAIDLGHRVGMLAALFLLIFPTAYFLHIGYTEALFLALAFGSLWLARTGRWWWAGGIGLLAALARINGLVLVPALAVEAVLQWRRDRAVPWTAVAAMALVGIGFGIYLGLNWIVYGDPLAFTEIQRTHWFKHLEWPWTGIGNITGWLSDPNPDSALLYGWAELAAIFLGLVATIATAIWWRASWAAWMAGNWLIMVSTSFVISVPRYVLVLFGIVVGFAVIADRWPKVGWLLAAASAFAMAWFTWRFAVGLWAF